MVKPDSIHIKTMNFSLWSIFAYGGPKKKRATVFSSKPDCASDLIYLRFYVYNDNDDSRRQVEMKDEQRFCESKRSREKPFKLSNDNKWLTVKVTNIEEGWKLDKTNPEQIYHCNKPYGRKKRAVDAIDIIAKPKKGREVNGFSCKIMFQQDGDEEVHEIYVNPGFPPLKLSHATIEKFCQDEKSES
ncbi:uncharacterized protein LOC111344511 [Stylophora pistillata]|uniref:uncharacterized protein LOC111344511 n=1 Tax=Stylophora pistillata TaxID=50429 RepID=UPI000C054D73|nr:uncharacterized protein LOC111344511 [Stylophora pistillata]